MKLHLETGGHGDRVCILLHGLGANAEVWRPLEKHLENDGVWRWIAADLTGHGRSPWSECYTAKRLALDVAESTANDLAGAVVLGHSLGGVVALELAAGAAGRLPRVVFGLGVKVDWTLAELAQLAMIAGRPAKVFEMREAAIERHLKVCGLHGLIGPDDAAAAVGVTPCDAGWRLAMDPAANGVGAPDMEDLISLARRPFHLARGARDPVVGLAALRAHDPAAEDLAGGGHNAMVEAPDQVWRWVRSWAT